MFDITSTKSSVNSVGVDRFPIFDNPNYSYDYLLVITVVYVINIKLRMGNQEMC